MALANNEVSTWNRNHKTLSLQNASFTWAAPSAENFCPPSDVGRCSELYWASFRNLSTILCSAITFLQDEITLLGGEFHLPDDLLALIIEIFWHVRNVENSFRVRARIVMWFCQTKTLSEQWSLNDLIGLKLATDGLRWTRYYSAKMFINDDEKIRAFGCNKINKALKL